MHVDEYADPDVGEGLLTSRLGETIGGQVQDPYHGRVENAPSNATPWGFLWGGVVAKDGPDDMTLENYARSAEHNLGAVGADPRFYVQMYGGGLQSWHAQWATFHAGGRNFANPITMKVVGDHHASADILEDHHRTRANWHFAGAAVADQHGVLPMGASVDQFAIHRSAARGANVVASPCQRRAPRHPCCSRPTSMSTDSGAAFGLQASRRAPKIRIEVRIAYGTARRYPRLRSSQSGDRAAQHKEIVMRMRRVVAPVVVAAALGVGVAPAHAQPGGGSCVSVFATGLAPHSAGSYGATVSSLTSVFEPNFGQGGVTLFAHASRDPCP